jgi:diguanylate cyclase (GGDEF)-like protein
MRKVLIFDERPERLQLITEVVRSLDAEPLDLKGRPLAPLARGATAAVISGSETGLELLQRLSFDHPSVARLAVLDDGVGPVQMLQVVERAHPWAMLPSPIERARLTAALREALVSSGDGSQITDLTRRMPAPEGRPDFEKLVNDPLTGAHGYHYLRLRLEEELERASRYARPVSLVLIDLDDLRGLNDRLGRPAGDLALKQVASMLQAGARAVDRVGRWAGGTFALVLPETTAGAAFGLAERLRADIAAKRLTPGGEQGTAAGSGEARGRWPFRVTVSCGVACTVREGASRPAGLIARADAALHRAKHGGRNRSVPDG